MRATMSVEPPGGKGTISRIGFAGQACASAAPGRIANAQNAATTARPIMLFAEAEPLGAFGVQLDLVPHEGVHLADADVDQLEAAFRRQFLHLRIVVEGL